MYLKWDKQDSTFKIRLCLIVLKDLPCDKFVWPLWKPDDLMLTSGLKFHIILLILLSFLKDVSILILFKTSYVRYAFN